MTIQLQQQEPPKSDGLFKTVNYAAEDEKSIFLKFQDDPIARSMHLRRYREFQRQHGKAELKTLKSTITEIIEEKERKRHALKAARWNANVEKRLSEGQRDTPIHIIDTEPEMPVRHPKSAKEILLAKSRNDVEQVRESKSNILTGSTMVNPRIPILDTVVAIPIPDEFRQHANAQAFNPDKMCFILTDEQGNTQRIVAVNGDHDFKKAVEQDQRELQMLSHNVKSVNYKTEQHIKVRPSLSLAIPDEIEKTLVQPMDASPTLLKPSLPALANGPFPRAEKDRSRDARRHSTASSHCHSTTESTKRSNIVSLPEYRSIPITSNTLHQVIPAQRHKRTHPIIPIRRFNLESIKPDVMKQMRPVSPETRQKLKDYVREKDVKRVLEFSDNIFGKRLSTTNEKDTGTRTVSNLPVKTNFEEHSAKQKVNSQSVEVPAHNETPATVKKVLDNSLLPKASDIIDSVRTHTNKDNVKVRENTADTKAPGCSNPVRASVGPVSTKVVKDINLNDLPQTSNPLNLPKSDATSKAVESQQKQNEVRTLPVGGVGSAKTNKYAERGLCCRHLFRDDWNSPMASITIKCDSDVQTASTGISNTKATANREVRTKSISKRGAQEKKGDANKDAKKRKSAVTAAKNLTEKEYKVVFTACYHSLVLVSMFCQRYVEISDRSKASRLLISNDEFCFQREINLLTIFRTKNWIV